MKEVSPGSDIELLAELTTMPQWSALERRLTKHVESLISRLQRPSDSLMALVVKESNTARLNELTTFFKLLDNDIDKWRRETD